MYGPTAAYHGALDSMNQSLKSANFGWIRWNYYKGNFWISLFGHGICVINMANTP